MRGNFVLRAGKTHYIMGAERRDRAAGPSGKQYLMNTPENELDALVERMRGGNVRALSRLMTLVESDPKAAPAIMKRVYSGRANARRVGLAGPPGAGKSTLLSNLLDAGAKEGKRVAALCIDPTSPISGGALLGDRIRMAGSFSLDNVFIRSVASGKSLGGLAEATKYHTLLLEAFGADLILIETVGIGQVGYDIRSVAESLVLILVPESGDTVQILKSGILELADVVAVNKSDRDGANEIAATLSFTFETPRDGWRIPVIKTVASENEGTGDVMQALDEHYAYLKETGGLERYRNPEADLREALELRFRRFIDGGAVSRDADAAQVAERVKSGSLDPFSAAADIMDILFKGNKP